MPAAFGKGFAFQVKWIIELQVAGNTIGIGETYSFAETQSVEAAFASLVGTDLFELYWLHFPVRRPDS
jgi:hypothetical protein